MKKCRVFISYAHEDQSTAAEVKDILKDWLCWSEVLFDSDRIGESYNISDYVAQLECNNCDEVVIVCSQASMSSWWVGFECGMAVRHPGRDHITLVRADAAGSFERLLRLLQLGETCDSQKGIREYLRGACNRINSLTAKRIKESFSAISVGGKIRTPDDPQESFAAQQGKMQRFEWRPVHDSLVGRILTVTSKLDHEYSVVTECSGTGPVKWPVVWIEPVACELE